MPDEVTDESLVNQLNRETAKIEWSALQRFFAAGKAVHVDKTLDLIQIAAAFASDDATTVQTHIGREKIGLVTDEQAECWHHSNAVVWAVVVSPWVLVQQVRDE